MFHPFYYLGVDPDTERINYAKRLYPLHSFQVLQNNKLSADDQTVDYILIVAVLHHISSHEITHYMQEFRRILKADGTIIVMEPCRFEKKPLSNWFMNWYDKGEYIRQEDEYLRLFRENNYQCNVIKRFRKCLLIQ
jgi:ubiquinone/menaquinone biosynthesis C-methylase UbiE